MSKIRKLESVELLADRGVAVSLEESLDGTWNLRIKQHADGKVRVGIPSDGGIHFIHFDDIVKVAPTALATESA